MRLDVVSTICRSFPNGFSHGAPGVGWWMSPSSLRFMVGKKCESILVGGWATHLKDMSQLGWWHSQYMEKQNSCSKPPTSISLSIALSGSEFYGLWSLFIFNHGFSIATLLWRPGPGPGLAQCAAEVRASGPWHQRRTSAMASAQPVDD